MVNNKLTVHQCKIILELACQLVGERERKSHKEKQRSAAKSESVKLMVESKVHQFEGTHTVV